MQWFRREKTVLQLTFHLISNVFSNKTIWTTIFEFQFTFSTKNEHGEAFYSQKYAKPFEPSIYHTKFISTSTTVQAISGGSLNKVGWIESENYHKHLIKYQKPSTLIIGDSIAKGLRRYMDVWDH